MTIRKINKENCLLAQVRFSNFQYLIWLDLIIWTGRAWWRLWKRRRLYFVWTKWAQTISKFGFLFSCANTFSLGGAQFYKSDYDNQIWLSISQIHWFFHYSHIYFIIIGHHSFFNFSLYSLQNNLLSFIYFSKF